MARAKKQAKVAASVHPPKVGAISNLFRGTPDEVAQSFSNYGLRSVQIHPSFGPGPIESGADIAAKACRDMVEPFRGRDIAIAGVSAFTNFLDPDSSRRKRLIKKFDAIVEHAGDFGTPYVITETGTLKADRPWDECPENHQAEALAAFKKNIAPSVKLAEKCGVTILLKGYLYHVVHCVPVARAIHDHFGTHVGFVMDPANYFTRNMVSASTSFLRKMFDTLGAISPVAVGKDVRYVGGALTTPRTGTGNLDYKEFLELLDQHHPGGPLILEQIRPEELRETLDFLDRFFE